jgi:MTH538 TIR-like domain (DUF1863)
MAGLSSLANLRIPLKRKTFFSFHYADIMRVNNVRNAWKIDHPDSPENRSFYDSSLWESKQLTDPEQIKQLIRNGVQYTSVVCVLVGSETWQRRWVKYEIARSVIDGKGLLAVHLNSINHHQRLTSDVRGYNPIQLMGIARKQNGNFYLCEWQKTEAGNWAWQWYLDYSQAISIPKYMSQPMQGRPLSLASFTREYDFALQNGATNIGGWIDLAAEEAGR